MKNKLNFNPASNDPFICDIKNIMKKLFLFALFILSAATAIAQIKAKVIVKDNGTNQALANAVVLSEGNKVYTNEKGEAHLSYRKTGSYNVTVELLGYENYSQNIEITKNGQFFIVMLMMENVELTTVELSGIRAGEKTPVSFTNISESEIEEANTGRDVAFLLQQTPSVVATSDAGTGIGYTQFRVRGSDGTRVNVTVNGIPMNDAESHGVWWVNTPDLMSSTSEMQLQRGVGTSTNGAGAFGASLNLQTSAYEPKPTGGLHIGAGSFNSKRFTANFGSGLIKNRFFIDGRLSKITSDGYVDRASSDLTSFYLNTGFKTDKTLIRAVVFGGKEKTYQSWNGIDSATFATNPTFNSAGALYDQNWNVTGFYDNEIDNYSQNHYQLHWNQILNKNWNFNISFHYTYGRGYFEQYKQNQDFKDYGLEPIYVGADTIDQTDLIRRKWLDNDFYGTIFNVNYEKNKIKLILGGGYNQYDGRHFGEIIWARFASSSEIRERYYNSVSSKSDLNFYTKVLYDIRENWSLFADLQVREVRYNAQGTEDNFAFAFEDNHTFFNPKAGVNWQMGASERMYFSYAVANKEPNRTDLLYANPNKLPLPEQLQDLELGYQLRHGKMQVSANGFYMFYTNQLVLTGQLDNVGNPIRENVGKSYRAGIELVADFKFTDRLNWNLNATFSTNKNIDYKEENGSGVENFGNTQIAYSPRVVAASNLTYMPLSGLKLGLFSKYVGAQYLSNSDNARHKLPGYFINDVRLSYNIPVKALKLFQAYFNVFNVFDVKYASNGYTWGSTPYYYAQAGVNFIGGIVLKF